jgi:glyoxylase-like metal-dependent hydrolase (beta-lactamase superfamily II)/rhodanese-related sulfurtransferase
MFFKQFLRDDLGCASYLIGDTDAGEAIVVDPQWDIDDYLKTAEDNGMRIRYVVETHNHADHVSGHGKLAKLGAEVCIHEAAGVDYPHRPLKDGDTVQVGQVALSVLHTPGHRPEHIALAVVDRSRAEVPWLVLTGDALFVGDVGRPDLAVQPDEGAAELFKSLNNKLLGLEDGVELYPGHVAGSLCGKAMSPKSSSTIGFERRFNLPLTIKSSAEFVREVTSELPPQPPQFQRIVEKNRGPFLSEDPQPRPFSADEVDAMRRQGALLLDARSPESFGEGHIPGALNVHLQGGQFGTRAAWVIPPGTPILLVLETDADVRAAVSSLVATGQEHIAGYLQGGMPAWDFSGRPIETVRQMSARDLRSRLEAGDRSLTVLDVRDDSEWKEGHIEGAIHIPFHQIKSHLDTLPSNRPVATVCGSGTRSSIAASILQAEGFVPVNIHDGMDAWNADPRAEPASKAAGN